VKKKLAVLRKGSGRKEWTLDQKLYNSARGEGPFKRVRGASIRELEREEGAV